jgi:hypothetical protein
MKYEDLNVSYNNWIDVWIPWIRDRLGFRDDDEEIISKLIEQGIDNESEIILNDIISGSKAIIFGAGPVLEYHIEQIRDDIGNIKIIAADGATTELKAQGITPDLVLTDLDGIDATIIDELKTTKFIVLAHGDNRSSISELINYFDEIPDNLIWATQGKKLGNWVNTLGFTDGDRALCTVRKFDHILLLGFDFKSGLIGKASKPYYQEDTPLTEMKAIKLEIAQRIIKWISNETKIYTFDNDICPGIEINVDDFINL